MKVELRLREREGPVQSEGELGLLSVFFFSEWEVVEKREIKWGFTFPPTTKIFNPKIGTYQSIGGGMTSLHHPLVPM